MSYEYEKADRETTEFEQALVDYLYDGYSAMAAAISADHISELLPDRRASELGYLDGYADAMHEVGWFLDGNPVAAADRFELASWLYRDEARQHLGYREMAAEQTDAERAEQRAMIESRRARNAVRAED